MALSINSSFGAVLRHYRLAAGLTQEALAWKAKLHPNAISLLECDARRPRRTTISLLADALDLVATDRSALHVAGLRRLSFSASSNAHASVTRTCGNFLGAIPELPLVGRTRELAGIQRTSATVAQGEGRVHILSGEPGIGKTRLLQEMTEHLRQLGWVVATGRCYTLTQTTPFGCWRDALTEAYAAAPAELRDQTQAQWPNLHRLVFEQYTDLVSSESLIDPDAADEQSRLFWTVAQFLSALAAHAPLVIAMDDLHWADETSIVLWQSVAHRTRHARVLLLGAYRDGELPRRHPLTVALRDLRHEHLAIVTTLPGLSADETRKLIAASAPVAEARPELADPLHQRTGGNPLFIRELVRAYLDSQSEQQRGDTPLSLPEGVRVVVGERMARLSTAAQVALQQASVLGQVFAFDDLLGMDVGDEARLEAALEEVCDMQIIHEAGANGYSFTHAVFQEAIYADLTAAQRRRWHRLAGEAMARLPDQAGRAAVIAAHFRRGGSPERALPYLIAAGDYARETYAYSVAECHLRAAVSLARDLKDQASTALALSRLGNVYYTEHDFDAAVAALTESLRLARATGEHRTLLSAARHLGYAYASIGVLDEASALLNQVLDDPDLETAHPKDVARVLLAQSQLLNRADRNAEALATADRAVVIARSLGDSGLEGLAEVRRGCAFVGLNRVAEWQQVNEVIFPLFAEASDLRSYCQAIHTLCTTFCLNASFEDQRHFITHALKEAERLGDPLLRSALGSGLGVAHFLTGAWHEARVHYEQALALTNEIVMPQTAFQVHWLLGILDVAEGRRVSGVAGLQRALALAKRYRLGATPSLHWDFAEIELVAGWPDRAQARLLPLVRSGDERATSFLLPLLAWAMLDLGKIAEATELLTRGATLAPEWNQFFAWIELVRVQALLAARTGTGIAVAETELTYALARTRTINYPHEEVRLLYAQGQLHVRQGNTACAQQSFREALAICTQLGERWYAPHISRALKGTTSRA